MERRTTKYMKEILNNIRNIKELVYKAEYILIGAGSGLSTSAGIEYFGKRFEDNINNTIKQILKNKKANDKIWNNISYKNLNGRKNEGYSMKKQDIYNFLREKNIWHEITEHEALYSMSEISKVKLPYPEQDAKNLFVRDDKKRNYYLITVRGKKRVDLKKFQEKNNTRRLSFASENDLMEIMKLMPGSVSPFGILNDDKNMVKFYIDKEFMEEPGIIGIHPNENTATVWIKTVDLIDIIKEHGNLINIVNLNL